LEYLDYHLIKKNPKVFVGYSDITAVNLAIYTKTGIQTTDGHTIDDYEIDPFWFERVLEVIETKKKYELKNSFYYKDSWSNKDFISRQIEFLEGKKMSAVGKLIAGNISTFNLLLGTPYLPDLNNTILFLEHNKAEIQDLPAMERMLWQIRQNGIFKKISGLIIGLLEPEVKKEETKAQNMESILTRLTQNYDFPVLFNAQFGHIYPSWVLQNGSSVKIKGKQIFINN
jgi:muramoyltetrapeptide carboxypeptidase